MARIKVLARYAVIAIGGVAFFSACSGIAWQAAGAAVSLGSYAVAAR